MEHLAVSESKTDWELEQGGLLAQRSLTRKQWTRREGPLRLGVAGLSRVTQASWESEDVEIQDYDLFKRSH